MINRRPVARWFQGAAARFSMLRTCLLILLSLVVVGAAAKAAPANGSKADTQAKQADSSQYVGSETCATCHEEAAKKFADNPHTKIAEMHGKSGAYVRELPRSGQSARGRRRRCDQDLQSCEALGKRSGRNLPEAATRALIRTSSAHRMPRRMSAARVATAFTPARARRC